MGKFDFKRFSKRLKSMLKVDLRRIFTTKFLYVLIGISFVAPILILLMTSMMEGSVSINPQTGLPSEPMHGFDYVWQIIGTIPSASSMQGMGGEVDIVSMCNINMLYFAVAVLVCVFISDDFRSGYAKNLFTVRAKKTDYVASKTIVCSIGSALMFIAFFIGTLLGGAVSGISFETVGYNVANVILSLFSKIALVPFFVAMFTLMSSFAKRRAWLSILLSLSLGMLLFMMIPMLTPINASIVHALGCLVGSLIFAVGIGAISNLILNKTPLV